MYSNLLYCDKAEWAAMCQIGVHGSRFTDTHRFRRTHECMLLCLQASVHISSHIGTACCDGHRNTKWEPWPQLAYSVTMVGSRVSTTRLPRMYRATSGFFLLAASFSGFFILLLFPTCVFDCNSNRQQLSAQESFAAAAAHLSSARQSASFALATAADSHCHCMLCVSLLSRDCNQPEMSVLHSVSTATDSITLLAAWVRLLQSQGRAQDDNNEHCQIAAV